MKLWKTIALCAACAAALSLSIPDDAEARRLGGGRSFGGSSTFSNPAPAPRMPGGATTQQPGSSLNRQATNPGGAATTAPGMGRGMGGLFGGLLAGTLIGSLLMGGGFAGGGMMDIIIIGLVVYLGYRLLRGFRRPSADSQSGASFRNMGQDMGQSGGASRSQGNPSAWDNLRSGPSSGASSSGFSDERNYTSPSSLNIPADFDQEEFLRGAKMAYVRLQESWDKRDLNDIAQFATEPVLRTLRQQLDEEPDPTRTDLLMVNASLMEVKQDADTERAAVFFDVLMREEAQAQQPEQVREVWHFVRNAGRNEMWKLDGIQQIQ